MVFAFFFYVSRRLKKDPDGLQTVAEILLNLATGHLTGQIGEKGKKYYYLILTLFCYIFTMNIIGLIPKPEIIKPYTPTANINVTFGLAFVVFWWCSTRVSIGTACAATSARGCRPQACPRPWRSR